MEIEKRPALEDIVEIIRVEEKEKNLEDRTFMIIDAFSINAPYIDLWYYLLYKFAKRLDKKICCASYVIFYNPLTYRRRIKRGIIEEPINYLNIRICIEKEAGEKSIFTFENIFNLQDVGRKGKKGKIIFPLENYIGMDIVVFEKGNIKIVKDYEDIVLNNLFSGRIKVEEKEKASLELPVLSASLELIDNGTKASKKIPYKMKITGITAQNDQENNIVAYGAIAYLMELADIPTEIKGRKKRSIEKGKGYILSLVREI